MQKKKILFIDTVHPVLQQLLEAKNFACIDGSEIPEGEIIATISEYNGVVIRSRFKIGTAFLEAATNLEFIARAGAGLENIDLKLAEVKGIHCIHAPEGNRNAVAEHALGMLLSVMNHLSRSNHEVRNGIWRREANRGTELDGKTIGIIGFGNTGQAFAKKLKGFDVQILVNDPFVSVDESLFPGIKQTGLNEISNLCDVVSFHVPLTSETLFMANKNFFLSFQKPFYLINTSRGKVLKTDDLVDALESGKIKGAALDVLEFESVSFENLAETELPVSFHKLITFDNVLLSPHIAGWTFESHRKISEVLGEKILKFYSNKV